MTSWRVAVLLTGLGMPPPMVSSEAIQSTIDRAAHTVLVVDDNAATRYSTARVIRAAGFNTAEAGSGHEAIALSRQGVSAVVLDVHLPDLLGFEVCRLLRSRPASAGLPIVYVSAMYVSEADQMHGMQTGADAYLVAPVDPEALCATLDQLIDSRTAAAH